MTENKRYKVAIYDEKAISGYCVLDLEKPSQTARLKYNNIFIGTKEGCDIVCDLLNEQEKTIQGLKRIMKGVAELLSEEVDLFSDKATEHDINAYIELKELDNKDAYYMAISIKKAIKMLKGDDGMTEKRFAEVKGYCYDKKTCIGVIQDDYTCKNMINLLNEQDTEIEQLKQENKKFKRIIDKLEFERCQYLNEKQAKEKWGNVE